VNSARTTFVFVPARGKKRRSRRSRLEALPISSSPSTMSLMLIGSFLRAFTKASIAFTWM
jgi:hypothetical protein